MRESEIENLKRKAREAYASGKRRVEAELQRLELEYEARLEAIRWLSSPNGSQRAERQVNEQIASVVNKLPSKFTKADVETALEDEFGDDAPSQSTVVRELDNMVQQGMIQILLRGRGRRATQYGKQVDHDT